jgi:DNA primase
LIETAIGYKEKPARIDFAQISLPEAELLDETNPQHSIYVNYLHNRGIPIKDYPFMVSPNSSDKMERNKNRVIIPFTHNGKIVGYTSRYTDNKIPKYINHTPVGYVFGLDLQKPNSAICILTEGIFDALSIGGCAVMHDDISDDQARLLTSLNRRIIYVPDRDKTGLEVCDRALDLGYSVSIPNWENGIKDTNDAVHKYGKLPTLLSIIQGATRSAALVRIKRNNLAKRI